MDGFWAWFWPKFLKVVAIWAVVTMLIWSAVRLIGRLHIG
jgi:hypothetical protein